MVVARTDRPGGAGEDLSSIPLVQEPLEQEEAATVWRQGSQLFHAVSVPMVTVPDLKGVLIAGYGINETLARREFPDEDPIGRRILVQQIVPGKTELGPEIAWEIVGIVASERRGGSVLAMITSPHRTFRNNVQIVAR